MMIKAIISDPFSKCHRSYQIVYLWENIISEKYPLPIIHIRKWWNFILWNSGKFTIPRSLLLFINKIYPVGKYYLYFCMFAKTKGIDIDRLKNVIPVIIDFWLSDEKLNDFYNYYASSKCLLITSKEAYDYLLEKKSPIPLAHFPLSIPDVNISTENLYQPKEFDFLFPGRRDPLLYTYMLEYEKKHPEVEYVYQELEESCRINPYYVSNKRGRLNGDFFLREGYLNLLKKSKITFYATPGMDESKKANGFNQVTPRFLEMLSCGCLVMGRYSRNSDTEFYEMEKYCPCIKDQQDFDSTLELFFNEEWAKQKISTYMEYLAKHSTSSRVETLENILAKI